MVKRKFRFNRQNLVPWLMVGCTVVVLVLCVLIYNKVNNEGYTTESKPECIPLGNWSKPIDDPNFPGGKLSIYGEYTMHYILGASWAPIEVQFEKNGQLIYRGFLPIDIKTLNPDRIPQGIAMYYHDRVCDVLIT